MRLPKNFSEYLLAIAVSHLFISALVVIVSVILYQTNVIAMSNLQPIVITIIASGMSMIAFVNVIAIIAKNKGLMDDE